MASPVVDAARAAEGINSNIRVGLNELIGLFALKLRDISQSVTYRRIFVTYSSDLSNAT